MQIAVTGGTGYLGAHTVRALLEGGHAVRLMLAPGESCEPLLERLRGSGSLETVRGDVREESDVAALLDGCTALLHAAGVVGTSERQTALMWQINAYATERILGRAAELGLDPIVNVSSYSALFPSPTGVITPDTPTAPGRSSYAKTKGYADVAARRLQAEGAPITVTYPSSVVGAPLDTAPGVTERGWAPITRFGVGPSVRGGMQMVDVRDVAAVHAALMEPGHGPRRYICGGEMLTFDDMVDALAEGMGRRIRRVRLAPSVMRLLGRIGDVAGSRIDMADGLSYEAALLLTAATPTDDSATRRDLGIAWRDPRVAIAESVRAAREREGAAVG